METLKPVIEYKTMFRPRMYEIYSVSINGKETGKYAYRKTGSNVIKSCSLLDAIAYSMAGVV